MKALGHKLGCLCALAARSPPSPLHCRGMCAPRATLVLFFRLLLCCQPAGAEMVCDGGWDTFVP